MYLCKSYTTASVKFSNEEYATPALHAGVHFFFFTEKNVPWKEWFQACVFISCLPVYSSIEIF